jgi:hypothetical protein
MTLNIMKLEFFLTFLEFIVNLRASLQKFVEQHEFDVILSYFKQMLDNYVFNIPICTMLALPSKICRLFL